MYTRKYKHSLQAVNYHFWPCVLSCTMIINTTMSLSPIHHNSIGTLFLIYVIMDTLMGQLIS